MSMAFISFPNPVKDRNAPFGSSAEKSRVHKVPIDQASNDSDSEHNQRDYLVSRRFRLSALCRKQQEEGSAYDSDRTEGRQFHVVSSFRQQLIPIDRNQAGADRDNQYGE
jgi:hypothetical protein